MGDARVARAFHLVDAWQHRTAHQQIDPLGTCFQGGGGAVHGRGAAAHHGHAQAMQAGCIEQVGRVRALAGGNVLRLGRQPGAAQAIAACGQDHAACQQGLQCALMTHLQSHMALVAGLDGLDGMVVAQVDRHHATKPAQVIHPLGARNFVQRIPGGHAKLRLIPGPKGQGGQTQRRPSQDLGRAQGFHARGGDPGALLAHAGFVQHDRLNAQHLQGGGCREAGHAAANHDHVQHRLAVVCLWGDPGFGGQLQPGQVLGQTRFQRCESLSLCHRCARSQSTEAPEYFTTSAHLRISLSRCLARVSGVPPAGSSPMPMKRWRTAGSANNLLTA